MHNNANHNLFGLRFAAGTNPRNKMKRGAKSYFDSAPHYIVIGLSIGLASFSIFSYIYINWF